MVGQSVVSSVTIKNANFAGGKTGGRVRGHLFLVGAAVNIMLSLVLISQQSNKGPSRSSPVVVSLIPEYSPGIVRHWLVVF